MPSVNKVIILGTLGRDPEVRYTGSGTAVAQLRVATSMRRKNASGETVEETEWHSIVLWDKLAEIAGNYLKKGFDVYVEGKLKTRQWEDKEGRTRYTTEIVGDSLQLMDNRAKKGADAGRDATDSPPIRPPTSQHNPPAQRAAPKNGGFDDMDDDIPF